MKINGMVCEQNNLITQPLVASAIKSSSKELTDEDATNRGKIEPLTMKNLQIAARGEAEANEILTKSLSSDTQMMLEIV